MREKTTKRITLCHQNQFPLTEAIHFGNDQHPSVAALRPLDAFPSESVDAFNRNHWRLWPEYSKDANAGEQRQTTHTAASSLNDDETL
jgi:hypothetical protein